MKKKCIYFSSSDADQFDMPVHMTDRFFHLAFAKFHNSIVVIGIPDYFRQACLIITEQYPRLYVTNRTD